ncbi:hypothetical protein NDU88_008288 [Pleurodeles waltl]|uniref:Uncharacterized protein n=1 Tax=Pleurodeles waltl TaxID=8319 RepID=A0AAV7PVS4_PLEWA|nr:hypothetical protein NDU88_008288 [Pleurodeles waltl]
MGGVAAAYCKREGSCGKPAAPEATGVGAGCPVALAGWPALQDPGAQCGLLGHAGLAVVLADWSWCGALMQTHCESAAEIVPCASRGWGPPAAGLQTGWQPAFGTAGTEGHTANLLSGAASAGSGRD